MAITKIKQLRFYGKHTTEVEDNVNINSPYNSATSYCEPTVFSKYAPIQQLGIQALPGTRFYINNNTEPIIIGASGIYEMDLRNSTAIISSVYFAKESMERIDNAENGYLFVDLVYSGEG